MAVDGRVREDEPREHVGVRERPAGDDDAAPVVPERDDPVTEVELVGERPEIADAIGDVPDGAGPLRPAHLELVDRDHAPAGLAGPRPRQGGGGDAPPEVAPGRVAVHGEDRADRLDPEPRELAAGVEQVVHHEPARGGVVHRDETRPRGVEPRQAGWRQGRRGHHASSSIEVLMPLPMPQSSTRSPLCSFSDSCASVIGMEADPTFPRLG